MSAVSLFQFWPLSHLDFCGTKTGKTPALPFNACFQCSHCLLHLAGLSAKMQKAWSTEFWKTKREIWCRDNISCFQLQYFRHSTLMQILEHLVKKCFLRDSAMSCAPVHWIWSSKVTDANQTSASADPFFWVHELLIPSLLLLNLYNAGNQTLWLIQLWETEKACGMNPPLFQNSNSNQRAAGNKLFNQMLRRVGTCFLR